MIIADSLRRTLARVGVKRLLAPVLALTMMSGNLVTPFHAEAAAYTVDTNLNATVAATGAQIDAAIRSIRPDSGLIGLGSTFVRVSNEHGINALYLTAHAAWESSWGNSTIARDKNNLFGWTAYDSCPYACATTFSSKSASIEAVVPVIKRNYLTAGGRYYTGYGPTLRGMNVHYATDQNWKNGIASIMNMLAGRIGDGGATPAPAPESPAASCSGTECNGKDPSTTVCADDATTVASQTLALDSSAGATSVLIEVRWSSHCQTNWVRTQVQSAPSGGTPLTLAAQLEDAAGQLLTGTAVQGTADNIFGGMWYAPDQQVQGCVTLSGPARAFACTRLI